MEITAITVIVYHSSGLSQSMSLDPPATVNVEPNSRIEFPDVNGAGVGTRVNGDDLIVRLPNGGGEITLAGFQALHDTDAEATIGWGDGWQVAQASTEATDGDVITYVLIHTIGETDVKRYDIKSGDEILVYPKQVIEFPFASGDQMRFIVDGDHLVIQFPGELGFLTLLNFQKYLLDAETAAHIEWGLGGTTIASVEDVLAQLAPAAGGAEALTPPPEAGETTAGGSRDAANTFGDPQFGTPFALNQFDSGSQIRTAPSLPENNLPVILSSPPLILTSPPPPEIDPQSLIHDETVGVDGADDTDLPLPEAVIAVLGLTEAECDLKAMKTIGFDADSIALELANGTSSGLATGGTANPDPILLFNPADNIVVGLTAGGELVFVVYLTDNGNGTADVWFVQCAPINHDNPSDPDEAGPEAPPFADETLTLALTATGPGGTATTSLTIEIQDDGPMAMADTAEVNESAAQDFNIVIVFDRSGSMGKDPGVTGFGSRIDLSRAAVADLLAAYEVVGGVINVLVIDFSDAAASSGWGTVDAANTYLSSLNPLGFTDYDDAIALAQSEFPPAPSVAGQNFVYFLSDGKPTGNDGGNPNKISASEQATWEGFLDANDVTAFAIGVGAGTDSPSAIAELATVAYDGVAEAQIDPIIVTDESQLSATLVATLPKTVTSNVLDNDKFGTDGFGQILSIVVDTELGGVTTFTFDPDANAGAGGITDDGGFGPVVGSTLVVTTALGGTLTFNFADSGLTAAGDFSYISPEVVEDTPETFDYTILDGDGDGSTTTATITIVNNDPPVGVDDTVITNIVDGSPIVIPTAALLANDSDPDGDPLDVKGVSNPVGGTVALGSVVFTPDAPGPFAGSFDYDVADDKGESATGKGTITGAAGDITGTAADEILIGGPGGDTLNGAGGDDFLSGGPGGDNMTGGGGSDTFYWQFADIVPPANKIIFSTAGGGNAPGVGAFSDEDLIALDGGTFSMFFDGSANSLGGSSEDIDALYVTDAAAGTFIFSTRGGGNVPGVGGFSNEDLIAWDGSTFSLFFNGTANNLGGAGENIDALYVTDAAAGTFIFSTAGGGNVPGVGAFSDEDLIAWDGSTFSVFFDGSANSLGGAGEDIDAVHVVTPLADTITDFETGPSGDVLDLSDVMFDAGLTDLADLGNFLQILDVGVDAKVTLDPTGGGIFSGDPFAILEGVDALEAINVLTNLGTEEVVVV